MSRLLVIAVLAASVGAGMWLSKTLAPPPSTPSSAVVEEARPGARTPSGGGDFRLPDLDGETRRLADWDGSVRLVNFWATWCAPCRREIPLLKEIQDSHAEHGIRVIGIAVDERQPVAQYAKEMDFNYPVLIGQEDAIAAGESFGIDFLGLPFTLIIAPDGELLNVHLGELKREHADAMLEVLEQLVDGSLDGSAAKEALAAI